MKRLATFLILTVIALVGAAGATPPSSIAAGPAKQVVSPPARFVVGVASIQSWQVVKPAEGAGVTQRTSAVAGAATRDAQTDEARIDAPPAATQAGTPVRSVSPVATPDPAAGEVETGAVAPEPSAAAPEPGKTVVASETPVKVTKASIAATTVPVMTPAEIARAEAALRDGQARMSRARTSYRLVAIAQTEQLVRDAEANLERVRAESVPAEERTAAAIELSDAEAALEYLRAADITTADVEAAEQNLREIESNIARAAEASVTAEQVAAAELALSEAEASQLAMEAGPDPDRLGAAQVLLDEAQRAFEVVAAEASTRKVLDEQDLMQAADDLRIAQDAYSTSYWQNAQALTEINPLTGNTFAVDGLDTTTQQQHYAAALVEQEQQLAAAQARLSESQITLDQAREQEVVDVSSVQIALDRARAQLDQLYVGFGPDVLAQRQMAVDTARANLLAIQQQFVAAGVASFAEQQQLDAARARLAALQQELQVQAGAVVEAQTRLDVATLHIKEIAVREKAAVAEAEAQVEATQAQLAGERQSGVSAKGWMWPTFGTLTSGFGLRNMKVGRFHNGVDIAGIDQTPIGAARAGTVIEAGWCDGYGYCVKMQHGTGFSTEYGHLAGKPPVEAGQVVEGGTIIGSMGTTYDAAHGGYSTGVHLHFTLRHNGKAVDPFLYLP